MTGYSLFVLFDCLYNNSYVNCCDYNDMNYGVDMEYHPVLQPYLFFYPHVIFWVLHCVATFLLLFLVLYTSYIVNNNNNNKNYKNNTHLPHSVDIYPSPWAESHDKTLVPIRPF